MIRKSTEGNHRESARMSTFEHHPAETFFIKFLTIEALWIVFTPIQARRSGWKKFTILVILALKCLHSERRNAPYEVIQISHLFMF